MASATDAAKATARLLVLAKALGEHHDAEHLSGERLDELTLELLDARALSRDAEPQQVDVLLGGRRALLLDDAEELAGYVRRVLAELKSRSVVEGDGDVGD